ncbi:sialoadhesin-like isoform X2 [Clupea harengus]|uniref:Sialoadhesin-like isoform X2 n=1 Tax=Clupea harengus TaxID=7950 RepID=A0A6P8FX19_CLUHA|nr:sialoadhesin-like isoform X2 [Clupea harengus]
MDTQRLIRLFGISFTAACLLTTSQGINIEMPRSVKAVVGSCVLVPCQTQSHTRVNWYKHQSMGWPVIYDEKKPLDVISEFRGRTSVPGHPSEGNCTLRIDNVRMSDGITLFPYINPESDKYYTPTVQIQPQSTTVPEISGPESPVTEGEVLNINCSILHSCPPSPPAIEWRGLSVNTTEVTTERLDTGMWVTVYTVRVNASYHQHRKEVHCRSSFGNSMTESGNLILDILYAPMNVTLNSENPTIAEHDTILLKCDSMSNPRAVSYQYLITNGKNPSQVNSSRDSLTITDVQRNFSAACAANNGIGTRWSAKTSPDIAFVSILLSDSFCLETDKMLKCVCRVEAHPDAIVTWMLNGSADLPTSVVPTITIKGNIRSYEVMLEGELAKQRPVVCVAKTPYSNTTQQMTIKAANTSFPWIPILAGAFGFLGLCGLLICCCRPKKKKGIQKLR